MGKTIESLLHQVIKFRDERDWKQFHNVKDLAISISLESSELLENFQWKSVQEVQEMLRDPNTIAELSDELADVLIYVLLLADQLEVDIYEAVKRKIAVNRQKYPVDRSFGKSVKYNRL